MKRIEGRLKNVAIKREQRLLADYAEREQRSHKSHNSYYSYYSYRPYKKAESGSMPLSVLTHFES